MATLEKDFTATGNGTGLSVRADDKLTYDVAGTFVGTVVLERSLDGGTTWTTITSATGAASGTVHNQEAKTATYRWRCSAFTSGTIETELADVAIVTEEFGNGVLGLADDGATVTGTLAVTSSITSGGVAVPTISSTSTLTNKTLTNPTINGAGGTLVVPTATSPAQTAEGSVVWDSNDDLLTVGDGSARKTMVDTAGTQTLTNKTLTAPVLGGTITGTYTLGGTPTFASGGLVMASFGELYISGAAATTLTTQGFWYKVAGTTTLRHGTNFSADSANNRLKYTGSATPHCHTGASVSFTSNSNNWNPALAIVKRLLLGTNPITTNAAGSKVCTVTWVDHELITGDTVDISGVASPIDDIPAAEFNTQHTVTRIDDDTFTITVATTNATAGSVAGGGAATVGVGIPVAAVVTRKISTGADVGSTALHCMYHLQANESLELWAESTDSAGPTLTVTYGNLFVMGFQ